MNTKQKALEAAAARDHVMGDWRNGTQASSCNCTKCNAQLTATPHPRPNGAAVMGSAAAVDCQPQAQFDLARDIAML